MAEENQPTRRKLGEGLISETDRLIDELSGPVRRMRQEAASTLATMAYEQPEKIEADVDNIVDALIDALFRPEAQTRWEALGALCKLAETHPDLVEKAYEGTETSLFDENSSRVRIEAFRMLASLGATSPEKSDKVWPLLDEAIQCFHGDPGYRAMLDSLVDFAAGAASDEVKEALVSRLTFDAENGRGYIKTCSQSVIAAAKGETADK
ncbi:HEAT repeat domain-containing protein [uncultured Parolsenella sp.]|uniref:HEAT repeat domain-containing protein n=1 Tax=uncultured Parolsenella sp. TaxID=2083008 RepID=UPI0025E03124|nr:HEAT repeat domain-containing protein [uncultured Parolsenella sp.]